MRQFYYDIQIDGKPILVPDAGVSVEYIDLDSAESGRDESGVMQRIVSRYGVMNIHLPYDSVSRLEYAYMESLFAGKSTFMLTYRDHNGDITERQCYRSNHSIVFLTVLTGLYSNYAFNIIEC